MNLERTLPIFLPELLKFKSCGKRPSLLPFLLCCRKCGDASCDDWDEYEDRDECKGVDAEDAVMLDEQTAWCH